MPLHVRSGPVPGTDHAARDFPVVNARQSSQRTGFGLTGVRQTVEGGMVREGEAILAGGGELGEVIRSTDWSSTPLGPIDTWPEHLRTSVSLCINSHYPIVILWSPDFLTIYNDAARPIVGTRHPHALGRPAYQVWPDIWSIVEPMLKSVMESGEPTWSEDLMLPMERYGFTEERYFTFSFAPIYDESTRICGIFTTILETTRRAISERRGRILMELNLRMLEAGNEDDACVRAVHLLENDKADIPFVDFYLLEEGGHFLRLAACAGVAEDSPPARKRIDLDAPVEVTLWPFHQVTDRQVLVEDVIAKFGPLVVEPWPEPIRQAVILPLCHAGTPNLLGYIIIGLSPHLPFDIYYERFVDLIADRATAAIEHARARREEKQRTEALARLDRAKTTFFSNISHELRTPLTLILGPIEEALASPDRALYGENLDVVYRNTLRLLKLVNTLLDFSSIEAGRIQAKYEPIDITTLTTDIASSFRSTIERGGLRFIVDCAPIPEPVYVDRDMWEKILLNLLSNAFKFTLEGEIAVHLYAEEGYVILEVRDTGAGIPKEEQERIFERFHRTHDVEGRAREGTGIGLALVRELVHLHGGEISVQSTPGVGSVFTVKIPTGKAHLPPEQIGQPPAVTPVALGAVPYVEEALQWLPEDTKAMPPREVQQATEQQVPKRILPEATQKKAADHLPEAGATATPGARILVADDNADMRGYLRRLLQGRYTVETASNGRTALESAREQIPDLVLADVMMPGLSGFELLKALREDDRTREVPVILLSARAGEEARIEGLEAGTDDYLVKPFSSRVLMARVEAQLRLARMRQEAAERERAYTEQLRALNATLEKRVEQRTRDLKWANTMLEQRNQELQDFLYAGSHDLQEPLRQIRVFDTMLRSEVDGNLSKQGEFYLERIQKAAERMSELVADLLAFSRVATQKEPFVQVDLNEVASSVIGDLNAMILETGTQIEVGVLPTIEADPVQMHQLLHNLVENAIKFRDPNRTPVIRIQGAIVPARQEEGARAKTTELCRLTVEDNGIGFDEKYLNRIFAPFQRLHAKDQYAGTGIGLAICRRIVEQHGGTIWAESQPGRGSTFIVKLPVRAAKPEYIPEKTLQPNRNT